VGVRIINAKAATNYQLHLRLSVTQGQIPIPPYYAPSTLKRVSYQELDE
jgi:hypothetical protein